MTLKEQLPLLSGEGKSVLCNDLDFAFAKSLTSPLSVGEVCFLIF